MSEMTPAELDRWLAEHVMGWDWRQIVPVYSEGYVPRQPFAWHNADGYVCALDGFFAPTSNIAQAIEAAEKARADGRIRRWRLYSDHLGGADVDANGACHESWRMGLAHALCHALHAALA